MIRILPPRSVKLTDRRRVLAPCRQGDLQAVLDEQWHLLWDQRSWSEDASADETAVRCARKARPGGASGARPCPRRVLPGRVRSIRRHRRTRRDPRPHGVRSPLRPRPHGRRRAHQPGRRPRRVQQPVPALRAHQHVDRAGGRQLPTSPKRRETDRRIVPHLSNGNVRLQQGRFRVDPVRDTQARPSSTVLTVRPWFASRRGRSTPATVTAG